VECISTEIHDRRKTVVLRMARSTLRAALALGVAVSALVWSAEAAGHVVPVPQSVRTGTVVPLSLAVPNERQEPMNGFTATVPSGFRIVEARPADGWTADGGRRHGAVARWPARPSEYRDLRRPSRRDRRSRRGDPRLAPALSERRAGHLVRRSDGRPSPPIACRKHLGDSADACGHRGLRAFGASWARRARLAQEKRQIGSRSRRCATFASTLRAMRGVVSTT
jgi:hypothetical protein